MEAISNHSQNRLQQTLMMSDIEYSQDAYGNWLPLLPLEPPEPLVLPPTPLPQDAFLQPGSQDCLLPTRPWIMSPLEAELTSVPPNSLSSPRSSPPMDLQRTPPTATGATAPPPSMAALWNQAWVGPSVLPWDQPAGNYVATMPEVVEKVEPVVSPSQLELPPEPSAVPSETVSSSSKSPSQRVRFGIPSQGSRSSQSPLQSPKEGSGGENVKVRNRHNRVEKNYRSRLNSRFLGLLKVLLKEQTNDSPRLGGKFEALSRGAVLDMASERIESLEAENHLLKLKVKTCDGLKNMYQIYSVQQHAAKDEG